jgi:hypothetical protein
MPTGASGSTPFCVPIDMPGGVGHVVLGRVAGTIVVNEFGTRGAAKGTDKFVGVTLIESEAGDQLEDERRQIRPAARSGISRLGK